MQIRQERPFSYGYNPITTIGESEQDTLMDFGILRLDSNRIEVNREEKERAFLLVQGHVELTWNEKKITALRRSCFDENPWVLHVPHGIEVMLKGLSETEICVIQTENEKMFPAKLYTQQECVSEERGKGTMRETSTRIVRTVFDYTNTPDANLVLGEVIGFPGKWSSYPPHFHSQPEIYFYKFLPENGYGFCELGDKVLKLKNNDTVKILNVTHPQTTAPGYAMYYIWAIRHLESKPYITPTFVPEHLWVTKPDAKIWPEEK